MAISLTISLWKANYVIRLFLFLLTNTVATVIYAQSLAASKYLNIAYGQYLNFQLDSCIETISSAPNDPMIRYLQILVNSTEIFISDDRKLYKERKHMETDQLDDLSFSNEYNHFLRSEIKLQWAVLKLKYGDEFSAFWSLRQAYNIARENIEHNPNFLPSLKTLGLLHVLYGVFPDKYAWILSLFGIEGNVSQGLSELNEIYESGDFLSLEAGISISMLHAYLLNDSEKAAMAMRPIQSQSSRLLIDYAYSLVLMKNAQSALAFNILKEAKSQYPMPFAIPQVNYLLGEIYLQQGNLREAITHYERFLSLQTGKNMVKDANYKIGICYLIQGNENLSSKYFDKARSVDYTRNEADKNARMEIESGHFSSKKLYQLRYATDGGYFDLAQQFYKEIDPKLLNDADLCEYYYRSARLFHKTGNIEAAIENYKETIDLQEENPWYFAPNSALQLGLIYRSASDLENAEMYLKSVSKYKDYPYQTSIRQKAKAALKELP